MRYTTASAINLAILTLGVVIGVFLAPHITKTASANPIAESQAVSGQNQAPIPPPVPASQSVPKITPVTPSLTTGTVGIYLVLAHHIQSDELVVNGYDLLKLQNAQLLLLSRFVPPAEIQKAVNDSKANELFSVQQPTPAPAPAPAK